MQKDFCHSGLILQELHGPHNNTQLGPCYYIKLVLLTMRKVKRNANKNGRHRVMP